MRRIVWAWLAIPASPAAAHARECECLVHHWSSPEYLAEIRLQLAAMLGIALIAAAWMIVLRLRRLRRCD